MATGIKPKDVATSAPTNPLRVRDNRVVSPTLGGSGNSVNKQTFDLDLFQEGKGVVRSTKVSTKL